MEALDLSNVASKNRGCIGKQGDSRLKDEVWTHILYFLRSTKLKGCISTLFIVCPSGKHKIARLYSCYRRPVGAGRAV